MTQSATGPAPWGTIDVSVTASFVSAEPVILSAGTNLYRVFSYPDAADQFPSWEVGSWWSPTAIPDSEAEWRGGFAVEESWNGGQYYTQWTLPADTYVWKGPTSLQPGEYIDGDPACGYYLPGGLIQIYISPDLLGIGTWTPKNSPWTPSQLSPPPTPPAPAPETIAGLAQRLGELSAGLTSMAEEGRGKGHPDYHLLFLARRVGKERDLLQKFEADRKADAVQSIVHRLTGLTRHVHTHYPWSPQAGTATVLVKDIVMRAVRILHGTAVASVG